MDVSDNGGPTAGWHRDPLGRYAYRWWNGDTWSDQVHRGSGQAFTDPMGLSPGPAAQWPQQSQFAQPQYSQSQYQQYPQGQYPQGQGFQQSLPQQLVVTNATKTPGISVASLVLGIGAFFVSLVPVVGLVCLPFALVGLVLGFSGISRARRGIEGRGLAIAGVVASVLAILVSMVWVVTLLVAADSVSDFDKIDIDPSNGVCDESRYLQDPDC